MNVPAICPFCKKTINIERTMQISCPECGSKFTYTDLQRQKLLIDYAAEQRELAAAKDYFLNTEFMSAYEHFRKALEANKNSYSAQYFVSLCKIYLNESAKEFDVIGSVVSAISSSLELMPLAGAPAVDRLRFIAAMLNETKIIIINRLTALNELFENDIFAYRKDAIFSLGKLLDLFKIDREFIMSFAPDISTVLLEIAECAIGVCYKAVQTVAVGEELYCPSTEEYRKISSLCNDYCYFAQLLNPQFNTKNFSPDFSQNNMLNEKVMSMFEKFDAQHKALAKKFIIGDINEYDNILRECEKALSFTVSSCYKSMCTRQSEQHLNLLIDGLQLISRLLMPRVVLTDKKLPEFRIAKFGDIVDYCDTMNKFIQDLDEFNEYASTFLEEFYSRLYEIMEMYFTDEYAKYSKLYNKGKNLRGDDYKYYEKLLFVGACCCVPALPAYVEFYKYADKNRAKLIKICKQAAEAFLMLHGFKINELEQSNFYRPILDIYNAVLEVEP